VTVHSQQQSVLKHFTIGTLPQPTILSLSLWSMSRGHSHIHE